MLEGEVQRSFFEMNSDYVDSTEFKKDFMKRLNSTNVAAKLKESIAEFSRLLNIVIDKFVADGYEFLGR